eukprot:TRINITY_DN4631_c0_g1_i1.p1 TRINITY_DN4631_c0_g1~~TRINITY_DN4631_c0_g1_i1.p1  ORF type:complete len:308 (-),score=44.18 TRINITY_DN4631_c0_g1_i1:70-993(-)
MENLQQLLGRWSGSQNVKVAALTLGALLLTRRLLRRPPRSLRDDVVVMTGGGSGIGRLMSLKFAREGCKIAVWDLNLTMAEETVAQITAEGGVAMAYSCDVSDADKVREAAALTIRDFGKVDILVNNAGIVSGKKLLEIPEALAKKTLEVNTLAHIWTTKAFLPGMLQRNHGYVVTIASAAGLIGVTGLADYCASKFGAVGFHEALRFELKGTNVGSTCVCPYYINTGMFDGVQTRFPLLLPILKPEYVANQIISAVQHGQAYLYLPRVVKITYLARYLPTSLGDWFIDLLGINATMDHFKGRGTTA